MIERLPSQSRKAFNYEAQIAKIEEEIERYQKLKLGLYENFIGGVIDKSEYFEFRNSYSCCGTDVYKRQSPPIRLLRAGQQLVHRDSFRVFSLGQNVI